LKDSSGDDANFRFVLADIADKPEFFVMTGSELVVDSVLLMGAHGAVPGLGNVDPAGYVRLYDSARRGDWEAARRGQARLCRLFEVAWCSLPRTSLGAAGVGGFKTALVALGVIAGNTMPRPLPALNAEEVQKVRGVLKDVGLL